MKRKLSYATIYELYNVLNRMRDVTGIKVAFAIAKNIVSIETEAKFFGDRRMKLVREYGKEGDGGFYIKPDDANFKEFAEKFSELANGETEVELYTLPADTQMDAFECENAKASDYLVIMDYLVEKPEQEQEDTKADEN